MDQKTIVLCIAGGAVVLVLLGLAWSRLRAWLTARELRHAYQPRPLFSAHERAAYKALRDTVIVNGATTFMVGLSSAFAAYLSLTGIPRTLAAAMLGITDNKILLFVLINLFLLIVGCLVDNIPATIILAPILLPVVTALGMSPVTFGIMLTMNLAIGFCTPPYGIDLFVASAISGVSIGKMMKYMIWFLFALLVVLMLVTYWPAFTLFAFT